MGVLRHKMPGDRERSKWLKVSADLEGKVASLKELQELFPSKNGSDVNIISKTKNYDIYGHKNKKYVAYHCKTCDEIIIGPPTIIDDDSMNVPLAGRKGYDIHCCSCYAYLGGRTFNVRSSC